MNKWDAKFGFFWYNDDEIFNFTQDDFDKKAKSYADIGITHVITFSCTHFRWSMYEHWDAITECLRKMVVACHKYDIKLIEHHSTHLTFDPLNEEEWDYFERVLKIRRSKIDSWDNIRNFVTDNFTKEFRQIDGRTNEYARSSYKGYCMCFNNEKYQKAYFDYLTDLYKKTGIDGIMADDVQYFGEWNACTCDYCRDLFRKETGYELPMPDGWDKFYGDYDNKVFTAWLKFKKESTGRFQRKVNEHFKSLGLNLLRPNYVSSVINTNPTSYPFDICGDLWDWVFQENCFSSIIRYSWLKWYSESVHRYAMGRKYNVPSMSMFYPSRYDTYYFTWSLAQLFGQMGLFTSEGKDMTTTEKIFRDFEVKYSHLLLDQQKQSDFGIFFPEKTWQYTDESKSQSISLFKAYTQGALLNGLVADLVYDKDNFIMFDTIILLDVRMMSDETMNKFNQYVKDGGNLIIVGVPAIKNENGDYRDTKAIEKAFMIDISKDIDGNDENLGDIYYTRNTPFFEDYYETLNVDRWASSELRGKNPKLITADMSKNQGDMIRALLPENLISIKDKNTSELVLTHVYMSKDERHLIIHVLDATHTMKTDKLDVGHSDIIENFVEGCTIRNEEIVLEVIDHPDYMLEHTMFISPEFDEEKKLSCSRKNDRVSVVIPAGTFAGYGMVVIKLGE